MGMEDFGLHYRCRPGKVTVSSDLPMGSGLGSSAAFCVSMSGALLTAAGMVAAVGGISSKGTGWELVGKDDLELVNQWAFQGEKIIHGKPSGIDNTVSTFGMLSSLFHRKSFYLVLVDGTFVVH